MTEHRPRWTRRGLLATGSTVALGSLAGCTTPESSAGDEDESDGDAEDSETYEVAVGGDGDFRFTPGTDEPLEVEPGDTVLWIWASDAHNVNPEEQPDDADWAGHEDLEDEGFEYDYTFDVEGHYHYVCDPHVDQGMVGDVVVGDPDDAAVDDEAGADEDHDDGEEQDDHGDDGEDEDVDSAAFYTFDDPVDATGEDVVEIETRRGDSDEPDFVFDPWHVTVDEGATIQWINTDGVFHTVTSSDDVDDRRGGGETFDATISSEGDTFEWAAEDAGTQAYYCSPHTAFMYAKLEIE